MRGPGETVLSGSLPEGFCRLPGISGAAAVKA